MFLKQTVQPYIREERVNAMSDNTILKLDNDIAKTNHYTKATNIKTLKGYLKQFQVSCIPTTTNLTYILTAWKAYYHIHLKCSTVSRDHTG